MQHPDLSIVILWQPLIREEMHQNIQIVGKDVGKNQNNDNHIKIRTMTNPSNWRCVTFPTGPHS